jgi:hypothetical protein
MIAAEMARSVERNGVLVVRAWVEGAPGELRARITQSRGLTVGDQIETAASNVSEVLTIVRNWLDSLLADTQASN